MGLRIPLDKICVRVGVLCPSCQAKVERGVVEEWEVGVLKALVEAEEELGGLDFEYVKGVRHRGTLYIITRDPWRVPVEVEEELSRRLSALGFRRVRIVGDYSDPVEAIRIALRPARLLGVNRYYSPDGSVYYIARVPRVDSHLLAGRLEDARFLLKRAAPDAELDVRLEDAEVPPPLSLEGLGVDREKLRGLLDRLGR